MLSRITIEMDFDTASPFIKVVCSNSSTDLRDRTLNEFFAKLQNASRWSVITFVGNMGTPDDSRAVWKISPVRPSELREEAALMIAMADHLEGQIKAEAPEVNT